MDVRCLWYFCDSCLSWWLISTPSRTYETLLTVGMNQNLPSAGDEEKHKKLMSCKANEEVGLEARKEMFLISWQEIHTLCSCISSGGLFVFHLNQWSASLSFFSIIIILTCSICYSASYWFHPLLLYTLLTNSIPFSASCLTSLLTSSSPSSSSF